MLKNTLITQIQIFTVNLIAKSRISIPFTKINILHLLDIFYKLLS